MNLFDLLAEVERCGGCLAVRAGKLHYRGPKTGLTPALRLAIAQQKEELLRALSRKNVASCWPPQDAASLVFGWNHLGRPEITLSPGIAIANLETWLCSNWPEEPVSDQVATVRRFLWESLPQAEVPTEDLLLEEWRKTAIPAWRQRLAEAGESGDFGTIRTAHWMLGEILDDPECQETQS